MILMIDNYDSFTYNLVQYIEEIGTPVQVIRNDVMAVADLKALKPSAIVISPGPGGPPDAGISVETIKHFSGRLPILGVCLGHQSIAAAFGGKITGARRLMHGKTSQVTCDGQGIFKDVQERFLAARYHSLMVKPANGCLTITSTSDDNVIMGLSHPEYPLHGVQFHPESFLTEHGFTIIKNFLNMGPLSVRN